jgi:hypothetical protein
MKSKHTVEEFINEMETKEELFNELNDFFCLIEDENMDRFLIYFYGE